MHVLFHCHPSFIVIRFLLMSRFLCWEGVYTVSEIAPVSTALELYFWPSLVVLC